MAKYLIRSIQRFSTIEKWRLQFFVEICLLGNSGVFRVALTSDAL